MDGYLVFYRVDELEWQWKSSAFGPIVYGSRARAEDAMAKMVQEDDCECFLVKYTVELTEDTEAVAIKVCRFEAIG